MLNSTLAAFTALTLIEPFALAAVNALLFFFASFKFIQTLQQSGYDGKGYMSWLKRKDNIYMMRLIIVSLLSLLAFLIFDVALMMFLDEWWTEYFGLGFYLVFFIIYIRKDRTIKSKVPLVRTNRVKRLLLTHTLVSLVVSFALFCGFDALFSLFNAEIVFDLRCVTVCLTPMLLPFTVLAAYYINEPFERSNNRRYIAKCTAALDAHPDLVKIGITGSYGKTSVKEILAAILSEKYSVLATPYSFNTPMGISKTVKRLSPSHEVFIAEMGARRVGDIKQLCEIVKPSIGVLTGVIPQHIETFGSLGNVRRTKYELIESLPRDGFAVFSADNDVAVELMKSCPVECVAAGLDRAASPSVYAENIVIGGEGTRFTLVAGDKRAECSTLLLGRHNVSNICLAAAVAIKLGMNLAEIAAAVNRLKPVKHRMELVRSDRGLIIIDDSFNSNINGTIAAMEVLRCFEGKKIVVTPGLVELGRVEDHENRELGKRLAKDADEVILVGKRRIDKIREGLIEADFPKEAIFSVKDLDEATELIKSRAREGNVIIFENDLPDKYN